MKLASALYVGWVRHRRHTVPEREFTVPLFMTYLDLSELDRLPNLWPFWSVKRAALTWLRHSDHLRGDDGPLDQAVRDLVEERGAPRPRGPVRMLTHLRTAGYSFNPVTLYYCFDADGLEVETVVAEVNNTPWGERHFYVLPRGNRRSHRHHLAKDFHVSPFQGMDLDYDWSFGPPGAKLGVHMASRREGRCTFDATLALNRRELSASSILRSLLAFPCMPLRVVAAIYGQAFRLWLRRAPFFTHPRKLPAPAQETP